MPSSVAEATLEVRLPDRSSYDAWAALLEPGMTTDVHVDPADPGRIAFG